MSEQIKVTVTAVVPKVSGAGKKYQSVIFNGTESAVVFEDGGDFTPFVGQTIDVLKEISKKDNKSVILRLPGAEAPKKQFSSYPKSDPELEKRKFALSIAVDLLKLTKFSLEDFKNYTRATKHYLDEGEFNEKSA